MITFTEKGIEEAKKILSHVNEGIEKAVWNAGGRALNAGKSRLSKSIQKRYTIRAGSKNPGEQQKTLSGNIKVKRDYRKLGGHLKIKGHMLNLYNFTVTPKAPFRAGETKKGKAKKRPEVLNVAVLKQGGKKKLLHTFVQKMKKSGHVGVFGRIKGSRMKDKNKEKIYEIKSPAAAIMATNEEVAPTSQKAIDTTFMKRLDHEVERLLKVR